MYNAIFEIDFTLNNFVTTKQYNVHIYVYSEMCNLCLWYLLNKIFLKIAHISG